MRAVREPRLPSANAFSPPQCKWPSGCALPWACTSCASLGLQHKQSIDTCIASAVEHCTGVVSSLHVVWLVGMPAMYTSPEMGRTCGRDNKQNRRSTLSKACLSLSVTCAVCLDCPRQPATAWITRQTNVLQKLQVRLHGLSYQAILGTRALHKQGQQL